MESIRENVKKMRKEISISLDILVAISVMLLLGGIMVGSAISTTTIYKPKEFGITFEEGELDLINVTFNYNATSGVWDSASISVKNIGNSNHIGEISVYIYNSTLNTIAFGVSTTPSIQGGGIATVTVNLDWEEGFKVINATSAKIVAEIV